MHYFDSSAYRATRHPIAGRPNAPRLDEGKLRSKPCIFSDPSFSSADFCDLPADSFAIAVKFSLVTPYTSKGDQISPEEHAPIVKEWVYQLPMVRPTTWKGRLRFTAAHRSANPALTDVLFGNPTDADLKAEGRLHFFPTFFNASRESAVTEIINPHGRGSRRGTVPVNLTCVAPNVSGNLFLLFIGPNRVEGTPSRALADQVIAWTIELIEFHGLGAKTLKGYGIGKVSNVTLTTRDTQLRGAVENGIVKWNTR